MSSHKSSATGAMYLYVNGRYVRDPVIRKAVAQAYKDRLPRGRYPFAIIRFDLPPDQVDVNVHPSKTEVRFMNPGRVMTFVTEALEAELGAVAHSSQPYESQGHAFSSPDSKLPFGLDFSQPRRFSRSSGEAYVPSLPAHPDDDGGLEPRTEESVEARMTAPGDDDLSVAAPTPSPWGQESPELTGLEHDVLILDLFVARQGLALYELEHYRARFLGETRPVLVPVSVNIPVVGDDLFNGVADILERFGFDIAMASPGLGVVKRIPQIALGCDLESWVETMFGSCLDCSPESREDAVLKQLATLWSHQETPLDSYEVRSILANAREAGIELIDKSLGIAISRADMASAINRGGL
jgi:DNA mismatch repair protein MutL